MKTVNQNVKVVNEYIESDSQNKNLFASIVPSYNTQELVQEIYAISRDLFNSENLDIFYQYFSVGYTLGVSLCNGSRIHIKFLNSSREDFDTLAFKIEYQNFLCAERFNSFRPIVPIMLPMYANVFAHCLMTRRVLIIWRDSIFHKI